MDRIVHVSGADILAHELGRAQVNAAVEAAAFCPRADAAVATVVLQPVQERGLGQRLAM